MTNKLPLSPAPSQCSTYSQLVAMVGWAAHSNRRRSGAVRLTVETVGIRLSVRLSVSVRQAGSWESSCLAFTDEVMLLSALVPIYVSGLEFGDDPHISVEIQILFEWVDNFFQITTKQ